MKNGLKIALSDLNADEWLVIEARTGRIIAEGCESHKDAETERDQYLREMHAFNNGPFAN